MLQAFDSATGSLIDSTPDLPASLIKILVTFTSV